MPGPTGCLGGPLVPRPTGILSSNTCPGNSNIPEYAYNITCLTFLFSILWNTREKFVCNRKETFSGVFRVMWRIRIHATYKNVIERIYHTCVINAFEICDEFVRILHTLWRIRANNSHVWKIRSVNQQCYPGSEQQRCRSDCADGIRHVFAWPGYFMIGNICERFLKVWIFH